MQLQLVHSESHGTEVETSSPHSQVAGSRGGGTYDAGTTQRHHPNYESQLEPSPRVKHQG